MNLADLPPEIAEHNRTDLSEKREIREAVLKATASGDAPAFHHALIEADQRGMLGWAIKGMSQYSSSISSEIKLRFLQVWINNGSHLRTESPSDLVILQTLRRFLPPYESQPLTLYRGDSFHNRCRRTYGISWSSSQIVAESFALRECRGCTGGSIVLRAEASARAIIAAVPNEDDGYGEDEYIVDRRHLARSPL